MTGERPPAGIDTRTERLPPGSNGLLIEEPQSPSGTSLVRRALIRVLTAVTLGSGLVNIQSVIGPDSLARQSAVQKVLPLEFLHISRSLTLLIGFALIILSFNIYKRKKRAFRLVLLLAGASVVFHLAKGLDYEEATFSLAFVVLLSLTRRSFTVESGAPNLHSIVPRLLLAATVALAYGVVGFRVLEPKEFGVNFTTADALRNTLLFLSLVGDHRIVPLTHYAHWFLNSLYLVTTVGIAWLGFALFRPVVYRYTTQSRELARAHRMVEIHGRCAQDFFKTRPDKSIRFSPSGQSFIAYSTGANFAVALSDPVGPESDLEACIGEFTAYCINNDWGVGFYQALPDFLPIYHKLGFKHLKIGDEAIVDLTAFTLDGKKGREFRRMHKLEEEGIRTQFHAPPIADDVLEQARQVSDEWLTIPGRRERKFTLGSFEPEYVRSTPVFSVVDERGTMLAFANIIPSYRHGESTGDLIRHRTAAPNGVMDYLLMKLFVLSKDRGFERFNLGMAPMAGFQQNEEARPEERAIHAFFQHLNFLFSFKGIRNYKAKFADVWEPRYAVYHHILDLPRLAVALGNISEIRK